MRPTITIAALAGLTAAANAQTVGTVTVTTSATTVDVGDTFTVGAFLTDNAPGIEVASFDVRVTGSGAAFSTLPDSLAIDPSGSELLWADSFLGSILPDGAQGAGTTANLILPFSPEHLEDLTVFTFKVEATQAGEITFDAFDAGLVDSIDGIAWINSCGVGPCFFPYDQLIFESASITVIPALPSLIPLALAAPLILRRRR